MIVPSKTAWKPGRQQLREQLAARVIFMDETLEVDGPVSRMPASGRLCFFNGYQARAADSKHVGCN